MIKPKETKRKFYNKWLYKVTLTLPGVTIFRARSHEDVEKFCLGEEPLDSNAFWNRIFKESWHNRDSILNLSRFLQSFDHSLYSTRIERYSIDLYTNSRDFYESARSNFSTLITRLSEPKLDSLSVLDQEKKIVCKKLPHDKYRYKVYLKPHKLAHDIPNKKNYLNWLDTQSEHVLISNSVKKWFIETDWNWDRRYMYVEDKDTLLMLNLRNSEVLGQVYEYVKADK